MIILVNTAGKIAIAVVIGLAFIAAVAFTSFVIVDRILISKKLKAITKGMTGKEIQYAAKTKLQIVNVSGDTFCARLRSPFRFFKYNLVFKDGKLKEVGRI